MHLGSSLFLLFTRGVAKKIDTDVLAHTKFCHYAVTTLIL